MPRHDTREECGDCYGFTFIYSGNYLECADNDYFASTRVTVGINPEGFEWTLAPGEVFASPEAVMMFSENGIGGVSRSFHRLFKKNLVRGKWRDIRRPLLINSWEAAYFGFDDDKLARSLRKRLRSASRCSLWTTAGSAAGTTTPARPSATGM